MGYKKVYKDTIKAYCKMWKESNCKGGCGGARIVVDDGMVAI